MKTRAQRLQDEEAGVAPSPPRALDDVARPRRTRAPKATNASRSESPEPSNPVSQSRATRAQTLDIESHPTRATRNNKSRRGRKPAASKQPVEEEDNEESAAETANASTSAATQPESSAQASASPLLEPTAQASASPPQVSASPPPESSAQASTSTPPKPAAQASTPAPPAASTEPSAPAPIASSTTNVEASAQEVNVPAAAEGNTTRTLRQNASTSDGETQVFSTPAHPVSARFGLVHDSRHDVTPGYSQHHFQDAWETPVQNQSPGATFPSFESATKQFDFNLPQGSAAYPQYPTPQTHAQDDHLQGTPPYFQYPSPHGYGKDDESQGSGPYYQRPNPEHGVGNGSIAQDGEEIASNAQDGEGNASNAQALPVPPIQPPHVWNLPAHRDRPYSLIHMFVDMFPANAGANANGAPVPTNRPQSVAIAVPSDQLAEHISLMMSNGNPGTQDMVEKDDLAKDLMEEHTLTSETIPDFRRSVNPIVAAKKSDPSLLIPGRTKPRDLPETHVHGERDEAQVELAQANFRRIAGTEEKQSTVTVAAYQLRQSLGKRTRGNTDDDEEEHDTQQRAPRSTKKPRHDSKGVQGEANTNTTSNGSQAQSSQSTRTTRSRPGRIPYYQRYKKQGRTTLKELSRARVNRLPKRPTHLEVHTVPDMYDENGMLRLGRTKEVTIEVENDVRDEMEDVEVEEEIPPVKANTLNEEQLMEWIEQDSSDGEEAVVSPTNVKDSNDYPTQSSAVPQTPQRPQGQVPEGALETIQEEPQEQVQGQQEKVPETPRSRGWGLSSFLPSAQTVSRFIPFSSSRAAPAAAPSSEPTTPTQPAKKRRIAQTEPRPRVQDDDIQMQDTPSNATVGPARRRQHGPKRQLLTKGQAEEQEKIKQAKQKLREKKFQIEKEQGLLQREREEFERERARLEANETTRQEASHTTGNKRKRASSPDVIPNPPGGGFGMDLDYFGFSDADEDVEDGNTPTKLPASQRLNHELTAEEFGDPHRARPYTGTMFRFPDPKPSQPENVFSVGQASSPNKPAAQPNRFTVPDDSDDESEQGSPRKPSTPASSNTGDVQSQSNSDAAPSSPQEPDPDDVIMQRRRTPHVPRPRYDEHGNYLDAVERARRHALQHAPKHPSRLGAASPSSSGTSIATPSITVTSPPPSVPIPGLFPTAPAAPTPPAPVADSTPPARAAEPTSSTKPAAPARVAKPFYDSSDEEDAVQSQPTNIVPALGAAYEDYQSTMSSSVQAHMANNWGSDDEKAAEHDVEMLLAAHVPALNAKGKGSDVLRRSQRKAGSSSDGKSQEMNARSMKMWTEGSRKIWDYPLYVEKTSEKVRNVLAGIRDEEMQEEADQAFGALFDDWRSQRVQASA